MSNLGIVLLLAASVSSAPVVSSNPVVSSENTISSSEVISSSEDTSSSSIVIQECVVTSNVFYLDENGTKVADAKKKYGDVYLSLDGGNVGDTCIAIVSSNPDFDIHSQSVYLYKYKVAKFLVNGVEIQPSNVEKGEYTFELVEGNNAVEVIFSGKSEISVTDIAKLNWASLFTVDNLLKLLTIVVLAFVSSGYFITLIKKATIARKAALEAQNETEKKMTALIEKFLTDTVKPLIAKETELSNENNETVKALMRVALLSQEGTPESKLAIIKELQEYKSSDKELSEKVKAIVEKAISDNKVKEEEEKKSIEEAKKSIDSLKEVEEEEKKEENYGKL
jgi:hypothetical protein